MTANIAHEHDTARKIHIPIQINRKPYIAEKTPMTGAELKELGDIRAGINGRATISLACGDLASTDSRPICGQSVQSWRRDYDCTALHHNIPRS